MLLARGWPLEAIDEGFKYISAHPDQVGFHEQTFSKTLRGPIDLLQAAFQLLMDHLGSIAFLSFVPSILTVLIIFTAIFSGFIGFGALGIGKSLFTPPFIITAILLLLAIIIAVSFINLWSNVALYEIITSRSRKLGWREAMRVSRHKILSFSWVLFLYSAIIFGGFLLLVIPGIIFSTWFAFVPFVFLLEKKKGMNALLKSRQYTQGMAMPIFLRLTFVFILTIGISMLTSVIGNTVGSGTSDKALTQLLSFLINVMVTPLVIAYLYVLFENVRSIKGTL